MNLFIYFGQHYNSDAFLFLYFTLIALKNSGK